MPTHTKKRTAKQKAATKRMIAANKAARGGGPKKRGKKRGKDARIDKRRVKSTGTLNKRVTRLEATVASHGTRLTSAERRITATETGLRALRARFAGKRHLKAVGS